ncbi:hypothetical protein [Corallococcus sp. CA053C]|uniref:hypothetical protein n=1 Tax=Corallococcus sp. CA053C TaxID=2316732 RepID=UPI0011C36237|nr:hypothetical protein [Corallococcus sp. CA053C]
MPDPIDVTMVFGKITRGLFYFKHERLLGDVPLIARVLRPEHFDVLVDLVTELPVKIDVMGEEFEWAAVCPDENPDHGIWVYVIYGAVAIAVWTGDFITLGPFPVPEPTPVVITDSIRKSRPR